MKHKVYLSKKNEAVFQDLSNMTGLPISTLLRLTIDSANLETIWGIMKPILQKGIEEYGQPNISQIMGVAKNE